MGVGRGRRVRGGAGTSGRRRVVRAPRHGARRPRPQAIRFRQPRVCLNCVRAGRVGSAAL